MRLRADQTVSRTRSHWWWRPGWAVGRRMVTMHLTMEAASEVRSLARETARVLSSIPELDVVPEPWLHLTMTGVGFADEVEDAQLDEVAERVLTGARALAPGPVVLDELLVGYEGVLAGARPSPWLLGLSDLQRSVVDDVIGPVERGPFRPHVSVAYANGDVPLGRIADALAPVASALPATVSGTATLTMMRLGRDRQAYTWDVIRQETLDG